MELSTKILIEEAEKQGYIVEILDKNDNFISISNGKKVEYIKQATKTSADRYVNVLLMENKYVTNTLLRNNNIRVPHSIKIDKDYNIKELNDLFKGSKIVVKPVKTNFGTGITILEDYNDEELKKAILFGLEYDSDVLVEEFIEGKEYRFFVINNHTAAIVHRIPANVVGDGKSTIRELVKIINKSPLRGTYYDKPLQQINLGEVEKDFISKQGFDFDSILNEGQQVFLRENSNVSTGGEPLDFTDEMHQSYKDIALKACNVLGASVTGIDLIIDDIYAPASVDNHSILELNFNPAIHMHKYPTKGKPRNLANEILIMLFGKK